MQTVSEYQAQLASGVEVTADDLNQWLGEDVYDSANNAAVDDAIERLIQLEEMPEDTYVLKQILKADAYISEILAGADGVEVPYTGSSVQDATPDLVIDLLKVEEGATVQLIIDGNVVDLGEPTTNQLSDGQMTLDNYYLPVYDVDSDKKTSLSVRVTHADDAEVVSDEWNYNWQ